MVVVIVSCAGKDFVRPESGALKNGQTIYNCPKWILKHDPALPVRFSFNAPGNVDAEINLVKRNYRGDHYHVYKHFP